MAQAAGIVVTQLGEAVCLLGAEFLACKVGKNGALEGIQEADAEVAFYAVGYLGVGAGDAHCGNAGLVEYVACGDGYAGAVGAENYGYVLAYQVSCRGGSLVVGALVINYNQFYVVGLAAYLDGGLYLIGVLNAKGLLLAACAVVSGSGLEYADLYDLCAVCGSGCLGTLSGGFGARGLGRTGCCGKCQHCDKKQSYELLHDFFLHLYFFFVYGTYRKYMPEPSAFDRWY